MLFIFRIHYSISSTIQIPFPMPIRYNSSDFPTRSLSRVDYGNCNTFFKIFHNVSIFQMSYNSVYTGLELLYYWDHELSYYTWQFGFSILNYRVNISPFYHILYHFRIILETDSVQVPSVITPIWQRTWGVNSSLSCCTILHHYHAP